MNFENLPGSKRHISRAIPAFRRWRVLALLLLGVLALGACRPAPVPEPEGEPEGEGTAEGVREGVGRAEGEGQPIETAYYYTYEIVATYPHDPEAFTQGLLFDGGWLYESTGLRGRSSVRQVELTTGQVNQLTAVDSAYFGEGLDLWGGRLYQLTWTTNIGFIYDQATLQQVGTFGYSTQGWGLTNDGTRFIRSDGSNILSFHALDTFEETGTLSVLEEGKPVRSLNELEMYRGQLLANVWRTDRLVRIALDTGHVTGSIDLSGLLSADERAEADVLNGIAYDEEGDRLFVTGKLWPHLFEIRLVPLP